MNKLKTNYRVLEHMDKVMKNEQIAALWEELSFCDPELVPVFLKGMKIMRLNGTPEPDMGTVTFFNLKNLSIAQATIFSFDKNQTESIAKSLLTFVLELNHKYKLKTALIYLKYALQKNPLQWDSINYDVLRDRRYEIINGKTVEKFDYLIGPLVLRAQGSNKIFTIDSQRDGYYVETEGQPHTCRFVSTTEALSRLNHLDQLNFVNKNLKQNPPNKGDQF